MEKLKPCPFCGGFGGISQNIYKTHYCIKCGFCGCSTEYFNLQEQAVEAWNRRTLSPLSAEYIRTGDIIKDIEDAVNKALAERSEDV